MTQDFNYNGALPSKLKAPAFSGAMPGGLIEISSLSWMPGVFKWENTVYSLQRPQILSQWRFHKMTFKVQRKYILCATLKIEETTANATQSTSLQHLNPKYFRINIRKLWPTILGCYYWNDVPLSIHNQPTRKLF